MELLRRMSTKPDPIDEEQISQLSHQRRQSSFATTASKDDLVLPTAVNPPIEVFPSSTSEVQEILLVSPDPVARGFVITFAKSGMHLLTAATPTSTMPGPSHTRHFYGTLKHNARMQQRPSDSSTNSDDNSSSKKLCTLTRDVMTFRKRHHVDDPYNDRRLLEMEFSTSSWDSGQLKASIELLNKYSSSSPVEPVLLRWRGRKASLEGVLEWKDRPVAVCAKGEETEAGEYVLRRQDKKRKRRYQSINKFSWRKKRQRGGLVVEDLPSRKSRPKQQCYTLTAQFFVGHTAMLTTGAALSYDKQNIRATHVALKSTKLQILPARLLPETAQSRPTKCPHLLLPGPNTTTPTWCPINDYLFGIPQSANRTSMHERIITIDSTPYYTILEGPSAGPVVILIHALMANHRIYSSTVPALHKAGYQTLCYDHIGHNRTSAPTDPGLNRQGAFTFDDFCRHLNHIWNTTKGNHDSAPAAIIGCSIGGVLAVRYHMLYPPPPGQTTKIISMAAPGLSTLPGSPDKWKARIEQWKTDGTNKNLASETLSRWFPKPLPPDFDTDNARRIIESCTLDGYEICAWATMNFGYTDQLNLITDGENVLILAGEKDGNIGPREVLVDASKRIKGSKYMLLEGVGHIPPMHPAVFEPVMLEFLGTVD